MLPNMPIFLCKKRTYDVDDPNINIQLRQDQNLMFGGKLQQIILKQS